MPIIAPPISAGFIMLGFSIISLQAFLYGLNFGLCSKRAQHVLDQADRGRHYIKSQPCAGNRAGQRARQMCILYKMKQAEQKIYEHRPERKQQIDP